MHKNLQRAHTEIHDLQDFLDAGYLLRGATIQGIDFTTIEINWQSFDVTDAIFVGCTIPSDQLQDIVNQGAIIFPSVEGLPYEKYRSRLYSWQELYKETENGVTVDLQIYDHFSASKYDPSVIESLCQRLHDHAIDDALRDYLRPDADGNYEKKCIGVMGGHGTKRDDEFYRKTALACQQLAKKGYTICSGGGPGTMEATNLGAYFAKYDTDQLEEAINILSKAPHYTVDGFHDRAMEVIRRFPNGAENIAIPTWFYGHEPSNVFASHIAKYFSNSIREDTLLAICLHGILFSPGSAGTTQEIFMDAAQNHYATFGYYSPMIFLGEKRYTEDTNIFTTLKELSLNTGYESLVHLANEVDEVVALFDKVKPIKA